MDDTSRASASTRSSKGEGAGRPLRRITLLYRDGRAPSPREPQAVFCSIRDNGVGFDPERALRSADAPGLGLLGIQERLHALGGTLEIVSAPGQGTELRVSIPIEPD